MKTMSGTSNAAGNGERYSPIILAQKVVEELFLRQY